MYLVLQLSQTGFAEYDNLENVIDVSSFTIVSNDWAKRKEEIKVIDVSSFTIVSNKYRVAGASDYVIDVSSFTIVSNS